MAKEQLAVIEMITNMILGKTNGVSKVDFTPQKIPFPENLPYEQAFLRAVCSYFKEQGINVGTTTV